MPFSIERKTAIGEMTRTETSAKQKSILFVRLLPEDVGVLRAEKSEG